MVAGSSDLSRGTQITLHTCPAFPEGDQGPPWPEPCSWTSAHTLPSSSPPLLHWHSGTAASWWKWMDPIIDLQWCRAIYGICNSHCSVWARITYWSHSWWRTLKSLLNSFKAGIVVKGSCEEDLNDLSDVSKQASSCGWLWKERFLKSEWVSWNEFYSKECGWG